MDENRRWVALAPPRGQTAISLVSWFEDMPPGSLSGLVLDTDDIHRDHAELRERGVRFVTDVCRDDWGTWASFTDPDGNGWVLAQLSGPGR